MNKKRLLFILVIVLLIVAAIALYLFRTNRPDDAYQSALPAQTKALASFDALSLASQIGLDEKDLARYLKWFGPDGLGVDLTRPIYGFVSQDGYLGLLAPLSDSGDIEEFCQEKNLQIESRRGLQWAEWHSWQLVYDESKALIMGPMSSSGAASLQGQMAELMKQERPEQPMLQALQGQEGALSFTGHLDVIPAQFLRYLTDYLPKGIRWSDVDLVASLRAEDNSLYLQTELQSDNPSVQESWQAIDNALKPLSGSLVAVGPDDPFLWVSAGVKGDSVLQVLRRQPTIRTMLLALNMCVDADMMLRSVDGDVSLVWPRLDLFHFQPLFTASLTDTGFLKNVDDWKSGVAVDGGVRFNVLHDNDFSLINGRQRTYFGVRDELLYVTSSAQLARQACLTCESPALQSLNHQIRDNVFFASLDVSRLLRGTASLALLFGADAFIYQAIDAVDRLNLSATDSQHFTLEVSCKRSIPDLLKALQP